MKIHTTAQGNDYWIDGIFAFINIGGERLTYWEDINELENWVDSQY